MAHRILPLLGLSTIALTACPFRYSGIRRTPGQEKRNNEKDQEKTKEQAKPPGSLSQELAGILRKLALKCHKKLHAHFRHSPGQADKLHERIQSMDQTSNDLSRWQREMDQMGNVRLKSPSATLLRVARKGQSAYRGATGKTGTQLTAVLESFREQMILPGHTRNARAIGSSKDSSPEIHTAFAAVMKSIDNPLQAGDKLYDSQSASDSEAE